MNYQNLEGGNNEYKIEKKKKKKKRGVSDEHPPKTTLSSRSPAIERTNATADAKNPDTSDGSGGSPERSSVYRRAPVRSSTKTPETGRAPLALIGLRMRL
jgi:hypothetical protein